MPVVIDTPEVIDHEAHALYDEHDLYAEQPPVREAHPVRVYEYPVTSSGLLGPERFYKIHHDHSSGWLLLYVFPSSSALLPENVPCLLA